MVGSFVKITPQKLMRRVRKQEPATRRQRLPKRGERFSIFLHVLEHVEQTNKVKRFPERVVANVSLHQKTSGSALCVPQTIKPEFQPDNLPIRTCLAKHSEHVSRSTPNLQHPVPRRQRR